MTDNKEQKRLQEGTVPPRILTPPEKKGTVPPTIARVSKPGTTPPKPPVTKKPPKSQK